MVSDRTEFLISQYVDGTIAEADRAALEAELATSAEARRLVDEYRKLDALMASQPVPQVDYAALAGRINDAIDEHNAAPSYRLPFAWSKVAPAVAVAACVLIGIGLWFRPLADRRAAPVVATNHLPTTPAATGSIQVTILQPEDAQLVIGPALQIVEIGPPAGQSAHARVLSEALVTRPNTLFIAKADRPAQDTPQSLY